MAKNKKLINNPFFYFKLRGFTSILVGVYIFLGTILIKTILTGFITDDSPIGFLSIQNLGFFVGFIAFIIFLLSLLAIFFGSRRRARKLGYHIWNKSSKKSFWQSTLLFFFGYIIFYNLLHYGFQNYIVPTFLICYGFFLSLLNYSKYRSLYRFTMVSILLGIWTLYFPMYWNYALMSLGLTHISFGVLVRNDSA